MPDPIKSTEEEKFRLIDLSYSVKDTFFDDVLKGLNSKKKYLHPQYFYDLKGSILFDQICATKEYYPTRTEEKILLQFIKDIVRSTGEISDIVELGSGSSLKTKILLKNYLKKFKSLHYYPIDISQILISTSQRLRKEFPQLSITTIISEYLAALKYIKKNIKEPKLFVFLGSSIGNYDLKGIQSLLNSLSKAMSKNDMLLIGMDMVKNIKILEAAYNDSKGITKNFNLNILQHINNELGANLDLSKFRHKAFFNTKESRIEMHLISEEDQLVKIKGCKKFFHLSKGESIHTENSYKFTEKIIKQIFSAAGLKEKKKWMDDKKYFSVRMFVKR
ncbi:L-histidine N(alpha)-methyltransferase [soil metagenome]